MSTTTSPRPLTARQRQVLEWIRTHLAVHGYAPTLHEVAQAFGFNKHAAALHRDVLIRKGHLAYTPGQARSITITGGHHDTSTDG